MYNQNGNAPTLTPPEATGCALWNLPANKIPLSEARLCDEGQPPTTPGEGSEAWQGHHLASPLATVAAFSVIVALFSLRSSAICIFGYYHFSPNKPSLEILAFRNCVLKRSAQPTNNGRFPQNSLLCPRLCLDESGLSVRCDGLQIVVQHAVIYPCPRRALYGKRLRAKAFIVKVQWLSWGPSSFWQYSRPADSSVFIIPGLLALQPSSLETTSAQDFRR